MFEFSGSVWFFIWRVTFFTNARLYLRNACTTSSDSMFSHIRYGVYVGLALSELSVFESFGFFLLRRFYTRALEDVHGFWVWKNKLRLSVLM